MPDLPSGDLADVLGALLAEASAELFGGAAPAVTTSVSSQVLTFDPGPRHGPVGAQRESRVESLTIDAANPNGPYHLATSPAPGHRGVRALVGDAIAFTLRDDEVAWAPDDPAEFTLTPRAHRSFAGVTHVRVDYGLDTVSVALLGRGRTVVTCSGPSALVARAGDLALAVLTLDADRLLSAVLLTREEAGYQTSHRLTELAVTGIETLPTSNADATTRLMLDVAVSVEVRRALREDEGTPITRIATPGSPSTLPVAVEPTVDA